MNDIKDFLLLREPRTGKSLVDVIAGGVDCSLNTVVIINTYHQSKPIDISMSLPKHCRGREMLLLSVILIVGLYHQTHHQYVLLDISVEGTTRILENLDLSSVAPNLIFTSCCWCPHDKPCSSSMLLEEMENLSARGINSTWLQMPCSSNGGGASMGRRSKFYV